MNAMNVFTKRRFWLTTLVGVSALVTSSIASADITVLEIQDGKITMEATRVSLREVAIAIAEKSDIEITASEGLDQLVDISLFEIPLASAIARISPNHLVTQKNVAGLPVITAIHFILDYGQTTTGTAEFNLPTGEPAEEIAQQEVPEGQPLERVSFDGQEALNNGNEEALAEDQVPRQ